MTAKNTITKVITPVFRADFVYINEPYTDHSAQEEDTKTPPKNRYCLTMLFDKDDSETALIRAAIEEVKEENFAKKQFSTLWNPLRDGDEDTKSCGKPWYKHKLFAKASSFYQPGVVDKNLKVIADYSEIYSGCYARASVLIKPFFHARRNGICLVLENIQKISEGQPIKELLMELGEGGYNKAPPEKDFTVFDKNLSELMTSSESENGVDGGADDFML